MKRDDLLAGLAARRQAYIQTMALAYEQERSLAVVDRQAAYIAKVIEQRTDVLGCCGFRVRTGEGACALRNARRRSRHARRSCIDGGDSRDDQMLQCREARFDLHPLASVSVDAAGAIPVELVAHRLSEVAK